MERLALVQREFSRALLFDCFDPAARDRLLERVAHVDAVEREELSTLRPGTYDLVVAGGLDTVNDLRRTLLTFRLALRPDSLFIGALPGGDTLPVLRSAIRAADAVMGSATPHVHPRIEPSALTKLLVDAGFVMPVVDVDRVQVGYRDFWRLVRDLRGMAATNCLNSRSTIAMTRSAVEAVIAQFASRAEHGRTIETFELLHFSAWTPMRMNG